MPRLDAPPCLCYYCISGKTHEHSKGYDQWDISSRLLIPESLKPEDRQPTKTCRLCGHTEDLVAGQASV